MMLFFILKEMLKLESVLENLTDCMCLFVYRSTFLKQMKLIHGQGFRMDEKRRLVPFIYQQILSVARCICRQMSILCIRFQDHRNEVCIKRRLMMSV